MKNPARYTRVALVIAFTTLGLYGQPREISREEFRMREASAYSKVADKARRERMTRKSDSTAASEEIGSVVSQISEFVPPDRCRVLTIYKLKTGTRKEETIQVGNQRFIRKDDGPWLDVSKREPSRFSIFCDPIEKKETATYRDLGIERIKDVDSVLL
jgi:hypothetical protein